MSTVEVTEELHEMHIDFYVPEQETMRYRIYSKDKARVDIGLGLSMFLDLECLSSLKEQLERAESDLIEENKYRDPLLQVWESAAAIL